MNEASPSGTPPASTPSVVPEIASSARTRPDPIPVEDLNAVIAAKLPEPQRLCPAWCRSRYDYCSDQGGCYYSVGSDISTTSDDRCEGDPHPCSDYKNNATGCKGHRGCTWR